MQGDDGGIGKGASGFNCFVCGEGEMRCSDFRNPRGPMNRMAI
jgi:hypothetical protein